jgi:hypothetical protein
MGLDMYAYRTKETPAEEVDFNVKNEELIHQWRKHPNLHGWMEELYYQKGGAEDSFNCVNVQLTKDDLLKLRSDIEDNLLPYTEGSFFGMTTGEEKEDDLEFIDKALKDIDEGYTIYYSSWW